MNIITLLKLIVDSGVVSPTTPTTGSKTWKDFPFKRITSGKGQGARVDLGLLRHFK